MGFLDVGLAFGFQGFWIGLTIWILLIVQELDWISFVAVTKMKNSTPPLKLFRLTISFARRKKIIPDEYQLIPNFR
jgi:hypothetical protein